MTMFSRRREFLVASAGLAVAGLSGQIAGGADQEKPEEDVSAVEDLMREHGVLRRILLVYEEGLRRLRGKQDVAPLFQRAATIVRKFVEDYHEKLEEDFLFPVFEKHNQLMPLVKVLREQHAAGRAATDVILKSPASEFGAFRPQGMLATACEAFIRMYRPHAAREDTVLFPALRKILSAKQLDELGDKFEEEENRRFGADGFERNVVQVAAIEKELDIYELSQFTAKIAAP
jgi:hemerythrin-like domain-containing protein